ncbi:MAG TPA: L-seryl-tRNA(Sec) selenium transferase [Candidatus Obscuribacterales bacterium]
MTSTRLPQVDLILRQQPLVELSARFRRDLLAQLVRDELARLRAAEAPPASAEEIAQSVARQAEHLLMPALKKIINGTGVVLNTNLGRAPLPRAALSDAAEIAEGYCNLEIDLQTGKRGQRSQRIERLLRLLTGAEAGLVVNNNAAAVVLAVNTFAQDKKVIVSRGELIEIGGSFRLPDVIEAAGGVLCEVGTTNRTRPEDYLKAADEHTGLLMRCHRSNFEIRGFTESASLEQLCEISRRSGVPLLEDLGSGVLIDLKELPDCGLQNEPTVSQVVATGCDLISFSGDKLLGGPQAGFVVGKKSCVQQLQKHPLYRALRLDKLALFLIEKTLIAYLSPQAVPQVPVLALLSAPLAQLQERAERFAGTICDATKKISCRALSTRSKAGGGSLPGEEMDSFGIEINCRDLSAAEIAERLRCASPPVVGIIHGDKFILDFRTIAENDLPLLKKAIQDLV